MNIKFRFQDYLDATTHSAVGGSMRNWTKTLIRNFSKIDLRFLPRLLFITTIILIYTPLRWYERRRFDAQVKKTPILPPVFILGHYRSGTTFLHYVLGQDPNMAYASTLEVINPLSFLGSSKLSNWITKFVLPQNRPMDNLKMSPTLPFEEEFAMANLGQTSLCHGYFFPQALQEQFNKNVLLDDPKDFQNWKNGFFYFLKKLSFKNRNQKLLLKTPANTARLRHLKRLFPTAKFIHIYRNPHKVYVSNERLYEKILPILAFQEVKNEPVEEFIFNSYRTTMERYFEDAADLPSDQLAEVAYEDFVKDPLGSLEDIYAQLKLNDFEIARPQFEKVLEAHQNYRTNQYELTAELKRKIYTRWGHIFKKLGYDKNGQLKRQKAVAILQEELLFDRY